MFLVVKDAAPLRKEKSAVIQINLGNKCNQSCSHCHVGASPSGDRNMDDHTMRRVLGKLLSLETKCVEFTGGTPELNPTFVTFIERLSGGGKQLSVRTSLTILDSQDYAFFMQIYKTHRVKIIASFPSLCSVTMDKQRGAGVFEKSIRVLRKLNDIGYGSDKELSLELVYNPADDFLPKGQSLVEAEFRGHLRTNYGVTFSRLLTMANVPLNRFKHLLEKRGLLENYVHMLHQRYNELTLRNLMCRQLVSVDYRGFVYDCDFNLAAGTMIKGFENTPLWEIDFSRFQPEITFGSHCYACTANNGSSCNGEVLNNSVSPHTAVNKSACSISY